MSPRYDLLIVFGMALAVLVLVSSPPAVAAASLVAGAFLGILTFLALWASEITRTVATTTGRAAAAGALTTLAVLSLGHWIGPGTVFVLAIAGVVVMVQLGRRVLRNANPEPDGH